MLKFSQLYSRLQKVPRQSAQEPATSAQIYFSIQLLPACSMEAYCSQSCFFSALSGFLLGGFGPRN